MNFFNKKKKKYKYINGTQGVISLFLCLIMTPILSIACALVEFSRYQNTEEIFQEVMDCSSLSTMANYDKYIQKRFGLFSVSQDCDINETYKTSLQKNSAVMEGMSLGNNISAIGTLPLSDTKVIQRQVLDFSESTVLTEILLEDLQLAELLRELDNLMNLKGVTGTLDAMNNMTTKIEELVKTGEAFVAKLNETKAKAEALKTCASDFAKSFADLYKKISEEGFVIDNTSDETKAASFDELSKKYLEDIRNIYSKAQTMITTANELKELASSLPSSLEALKTDYNEAVEAVNAAAESMKSLGNESNKDSAGKGDSNVADVADDATNLYQTVLNEIGDAIDEASEDLSTASIDALKAAANSFSSDIKENLGIDIAKLSTLDEYFTVPLSDNAKSDLDAILKELPAAWDEGSYDKVVQKIKDIYIPKAFDMDFGDIKDALEGAINHAKGTFEENAKQSVGEILTNLVNAIKALFDLDVFYDGGLNAFLDDATVATLLSDTGGTGGEKDNPYVNMLNSLSNMLLAVDNFTSGIANLDFFKIIESVKNLCTSIKDSVQAVYNLAVNTIEKIDELVGYVRDNKWEKFGELLLMAGYMVHNLPNRTMAGTTDIKLEDGSITSTEVLNGETLTGFSFADIPRPAKSFSTGMSKEEGQSSISALADFLNSSKKGGSDKMFRGAELEYILAGTPSELMNQAVVFMQVYFLRLLLDLVPVFTDPGVSAMASAATIACWAVYLIEVFAEPLCDTVLLVNGSESVNFMKRTCYLTPMGVPKIVNELGQIAIKNPKIQQAAIDKVNGSLKGKFDKYTPKDAQFRDGILPMDYGTHVLLILMFTTTTDDMLRRLANIVQLESNYQCIQEGAGKSFDITKAYTGISASADVEFDSFIKIFQTNDSSSLIKKEFTRTNTY